MSSGKRLSGVAALPYADRQCIVVSDDDPKLGHGSSVPVRSMDILEAVVSTVPVAGLGLVVLALGGARELGRRRTANATPAIRRVTHRQVRGLQFPPTHPRPLVVYVGDPMRPTIYFPFAHFHRRAFEHKGGEAARLLGALGATSFRARHVQGWSREMAAGFGVGHGVDVGARVSHQSGGSDEIIWNAELHPQGRPYVPKDLLWYPHEETWQTLAAMRLEHGATRLSMSLEYLDDYGITAEVSGKLAGAGLSLGGEFLSATATRWELEASFDGLPPPASADPSAEASEADRA